MASLANQTISSTYDGLIKTSTDQPVGVSGVQLLEDGVGNTLALSVGRANQGATVTGTLTATTLAGTLSTAAQTNITSVGTLSSLAVSGNLTVDTNTLYVDAANNRVGIGTSSPDTLLHLSATGSTTAVARIESTHPSGISFLDFKAAGSNQIRYIDETDTIQTRIDMFDDGEIRFVNAAGSAERMRIDSSGNVGIGTSAPTEKLQVEGNAEINGIVYMNNGTVADDGRFRFGTGNDYSMGYDSSSDTLRIADGNTLTSNVRLAIDPSGNVGIGESSPENDLHISSDTPTLRLEDRNGTCVHLIQGGGNGNLKLSADLNNTGASASNILFDVDGSEKMRIDSSGRVGIGTSSPSANLEVLKGSEGLYLQVGGDNASNNRALEFTSSTSSGGSNGALHTINSRSISGEIALATGGSERLRISSTGNVGIGTTSPDALFTVSEGGAYGLEIDPFYTSNSVRILSYDRSTSTRVPLRFDASIFIFNESNTERMRIDSAGNVGIGTSSPAASLEVLRSDNGDYLKVGGAVAARSLIFTASATINDGDTHTINASGLGGIIALATADTEHMRVTADGDILFGNTSVPAAGTGGSAFLNASNDRMALLMSTSTTSSTNMQLFYNPNGTVGSIQVSGSSTSFNTSSDYRLKENVVPMEGALDRVDALKPSRFNFIADPEKTVDGFLAHEVAEVVPEAISGEKDAIDEEGNPIYQGIDQSKIVPLLVGAIKELSAKVAALESQLNA